MNCNHLLVTCQVLFCDCFSDLYSGLPRILLQGDLDRRNIGLRLGSDRTVLLPIDWEWIGVGSPDLDVAKFVRTADAVGGVPDGAQSLSDIYNLANIKP